MKSTWNMTFFFIIFPPNLYVHAVIVTYAYSKKISSLQKQEIYKYDRGNFSNLKVDVEKSVYRCMLTIFILNIKITGRIKII